MGKRIVNKSVSFNVLDPYQQQMKEFTEQYPNFSGYIKRLIQRDMEGGAAAKKAPVLPEYSGNLALENGRLILKS